MANVTVLMYHHISLAEDANTVTVKNFSSQLAWLASSGFRVLSGADFAAWREGHLRLADNAVLLTFDDGWFDNWLYALPLLEKFRVPAVFFVVTAWPGAGPIRLRDENAVRRHPTHARSVESVKQETTRDEVIMRWSELLAAMDTGLVKLQSHSHSHGAWWTDTASWPEKLVAMEQDLTRSRKVLSERAGVTAAQLCWPKGHFTMEMVQRAKSLGFMHQFSTLRGGNRPITDRMVRRLNVEDRPAEWLAGRIRLYNNPLCSLVLGQSHQVLHSRRMIRLMGGNIPVNELTLPLWRSV